MAEKWSVAGEMMETCNCEAACPCLFLGPPTDGDCSALFGWHVEKGSFGDATLDGLNVVLAAYIPGLITDGNWKAALYIDESADDAQKDALTQIFAGQAGGHPAVLASLIGEVLGVKSVPIEIQKEGKRRSLRIPGVAEAEIEAIEGANGAEITLSNVTLELSPSPTQVIARSKKVTYSDYDLQWELSGKSGNYLRFAYESD